MSDHHHAIHSIDQVLIDEILGAFPDAEQGYNQVSQGIHTTENGALITRTYECMQDDLHSGILVVRGLLDGLTIEMQFTIYFDGEDFVVEEKIESPFILVNKWEYKRTINNWVPKPSGQLLTNATAYSICVLRCSGVSIGSCLAGCFLVIYDHNAFVSCVLGCLPTAGAAIAACIFSCVQPRPSQP